MFEFWLSFVLFIGTHLLFSRPKVRNFCIFYLGKTGYLWAYSLLSIILLGWLIIAAQAAPRIYLWPYIHGLYWFPNIFMPFSCILLVSAFIVANPLSIAPRINGFDHTKPGLIVALTRHPALWGFLLWSAGHIPPNGKYPIIIMFILFAAFSITGIFIIDKKSQTELGEDMWKKLSANTSAFLFCSSSLWRRNFQLTRRDSIGIIGGIILYRVLYHCHSFLFGINPTPPLP